MSSKYDSNNLFYAQFVIGLISIVIITTMEEVLMFSNILTTWSNLLGNNIRKHQDQKPHQMVAYAKKIHNMV